MEGPGTRGRPAGSSRPRASCSRSWRPSAAAAEPTPLGRYYAKNGFWYDGAGQMEQGVAFFLPQDMELVVLVNSPVGSTGEFLYTIVSETFTAHIEELSLLPGIS